MPPRIAYWTSAFEPEMEAIASEVALLRRSFPASFSWGINPTRWARVTRPLGICLNPRLQLFFRSATALLEPFFQLNHVFGALSDWYYLNSPRRRPTILTLASAGAPASPALLQRVDHFVVEYPEGRNELVRNGVCPERIGLIHPPVDLHRFHPTPQPNDPFTVLFASSPERADWLEARGLPLLLDVAALRPQFRFRLLWRPWGNSEPVVRDWIAARGLSNIDLIVGRQSDMSDQYRLAHVTVAPFINPNRCKPAPNSVVESLASGRPVVATIHVGLSALIQESHAGIVCLPDAVAMADGLDRLQADWECHSRRARLLAERCFEAGKFVAAYTKLYHDVLSNYSE